MQASYKTALCGVLIFMGGHALAESPAEIFAKMDERKRASYAGIDNYTQQKSVMGLCTIEYFEKATTASVDGRGAVDYMRLVPITEVMERTSPDSPMANASAEDLERTATDLRAQGPQMEALYREKMQETGLPGGIGQMLMNPPPDQPWLSANPNDMMNSYATMLEAAAQGKRQDAAMEAEARSAAQTDLLASAADKTRVVGRETFGNREAIRLITEDITNRQVADGQEFILQTMHLWVDAERYVPLKMSMEGVAREGNETRDLLIERVDTYQDAAGCGSMYEPFRSAISIAGIMTPEQQQQMAEAQVQLEQARAQLATLPESQKAMIMRQLGPQMEMLDSMASGNGIEVVSLVTDMRCNAGLPRVEDYAVMMPGTSMNACTGLASSGAGLGAAGSFSAAAGAAGGSSGANGAAAAAGGSNATGAAPSATTASPAPDREAEQQACLQEKIAAAQAAQKKKRGFGKLMSAVARTAGRLGNNDIAQATRDVYDVNATADDLASAAKDLGLTEDEIEACRNPN